MSKKDRFSDYEDYYQRAFEEKDIDELLKDGAFFEYDTFKKSAKKNVKQGYYSPMFDNKSTKKPDVLGKKIFELFFEKRNITRNKSNRLIVAKGQSFTYNNKTYKGGMFIPKDYFKSRF